MGSDYFTNPVDFLVTALFDLYIIAVLLRFLLQTVRADFYNPISQFIVKVTNPPLIPLRRVIPSVARQDTAAIVLIIVLQMLSTTISLLLKGVKIAVLPLFVLSVANLVSLIINFYIVLIIVQVILSWVNPGNYNPATALLYSLTEPVLRPARRLLPPISGFDLSPILVLLALQVLKMLIIPPIIQLARMV
jgi:YggT family protein